MLGTFIIFLRCSLAYASPNNRNLTYQKEAMFLKFPTAGRAFLKTSACKAGAASEQLQPHGRCCGMSLEWNPRWIWPMSRCLLYSQNRIYVVICSPEGLGIGYHQSLNQTLPQSFFGNRMLLKHQLGTAFFVFGYIMILILTWIPHVTVFIPQTRNISTVERMLKDVMQALSTWISTFLTYETLIPRGYGGCIFKITQRCWIDISHLQIMFHQVVPCPSFLWGVCIGRTQIGQICKSKYGISTAVWGGLIAVFYDIFEDGLSHCTT